ncbi:MFS transporter [Oleiagrimonas sp. C23AA]|uniref:MFS transporter n=1 Tax=Oleiagrimonas sp. C23AA TaxID=2719047 RepID=UPI00141F6949|nr:MFS transporter [Oleiagrimonas sp. C23AA]NII09576.1 MFS transporter [Oleiagrimonas sp. C23AA]
MSDERAYHDSLKASWWIAAIALLSGVGGGVVFPILPMLGVQLGLSAVLVGFILAANRITRIFFNPFTGSLIDRFGARWPVAVGLFLETVAVLAFSLALHSGSPGLWFLVGRVVWGVGSSLILVGALAAVMAISVPRNRGRLTGRVRTSMTLGLPAGMLIGGLIADLASPNAAFLSAAAITLVTGVFALYALPRDAHGDAGASHERGWKVWKGLLRLPQLQVIWCANALIFFAVSGVLLATLVVMIDKRGITVFGLGSSGSAGLMMALLMVFRAIAALGAGSFLDRRRGRTALLLPAALVTAAGFAALDVAGHDWSMALALAVIGLGSGALTIPLLTLLSDTASQRTQGRAMGLYQVYGDIGGSLGPVVGLQLGAMNGYGPIYLAVAAAMLATALPLYWLVRRERAEHATQTQA